MNVTKYYSFYQDITLHEAVKSVGADHVRWIAGDWARRLRDRVRGAWMANAGHNHSAYCALMQAGVVASLAVSQEGAES